MGVPLECVPDEWANLLVRRHCEAPINAQIDLLLDVTAALYGYCLDTKRPAIRWLGLGLGVKLPNDTMPW